MKSSKIFKTSIASSWLLKASKLDSILFSSSSLILLPWISPLSFKEKFNFAYQKLTMLLNPFNMTNTASDNESETRVCIIERHMGDNISFSQK